MIFHGGRMNHVSTGNVAGNVTGSLSPGSGIRWLVLYGKVRVTAVGAANRYVAARIDDGGVPMILLIFPVNAVPITDGMTRSFNFGVGAGLDAARGVDDIGGVPLPNPCILESSDRLFITISGGLAADTWIADFAVLEAPIS